MSLLLDALKRAEQAKQAKQGEPGQGDASAQTPAPGPASGLSLALEEVEPARQSTSSQAAAAQPTADRDAVRNVFASKQPQPSKSRKQPAWLLPVVAIVLFAVGGGGWYVWKEVSKFSKPAVAAAPTPPRPLSNAQPPAEPASPPATSAPPVSSEPSQPIKPAEVPLPDKVAGAKSLLSPAEKAREELAKSLRSNEGKRESPLSLKLAKGMDAPKVSEDLAAAYTALRGGNIADAKRRYTALVAADGTNLDARLGLATSLARGGEVPAAVKEYRKALEIDPQNSTALTALLVLADARTLPALESDLRSMLSKFPESAPLHFALGNALSTQSRWTEAQQAYFDAWRLETDNADYAFNLAVSLDQLRQVRLAQDYYQKALALAGRNSAQFDRKQVERRLNELRAAPAP